MRQWEEREKKSRHRAISRETNGGRGESRTERAVKSERILFFEISYKR